MTQNLFASIILGAALLGGGYFISLQTSTISTAPAVKTLQVSAEGKVKIVPDMVIVSAGVEVRTRSTQEQAYTDMNTSINLVKEVLRAQGIEEKNVQTSGLYATPEYNYDDGKQVLNGYMATTTLTIRVEKKDQKVTNEILDSIAKIENIRINGVNYDLADKEKAYSEARKIALEKAREKADEMAKMSNISIVSVQSISENTNGGIIPMYQNVRSMDFAGAESKSSTDISVGQVEYSATVNVSYEIQ